MRHSGIFGATQEDLQALREPGNAFIWTKQGEKSTPSRDSGPSAALLQLGFASPYFYLLSLSLLPCKEEFDLGTPRPQTTSRLVLADTPVSQPRAFVPAQPGAVGASVTAPGLWGQIRTLATVTEVLFVSK